MISEQFKPEWSEPPERNAGGHTKGLPTVPETGIELMGKELRKRDFSIAKETTSLSPCEGLRDLQSFSAKPERLVNAAKPEKSFDGTG